MRGRARGLFRRQRGAPRVRRDEIPEHALRGCPRVRPAVVKRIFRADGLRAEHHAAVLMAQEVAVEYVTAGELLEAVADQALARRLLRARGYGDGIHPYPGLRVDGAAVFEQLEGIGMDVKRMLERAGVGQAPRLGCIEQGGD